jgi:Kdo2-lipid IVA lauroyltransferase/acyltransferase
MFEFTPETISQLKNTVAACRVSWAGRFAYYCLPFRRQVTLDNMNLVFGKVLSAAEIKRLALAFYSHLLESFYENIRLRFESSARSLTRVEVQGAEHVFAAAEQGKGVLIMTGHFGNWEFAPITGLMHFPEYRGRFHFIRKSLGLKWLEKLLFRRFFAAGLKVIPHRYAIKQVMDALDKEDCVVFVMDQAAYVTRRQAVETTFFGQRVGTYRSLASIAQSTGAPVVPVCSFRRPDGKHVLAFDPPLSFVEAEDRQATIRENTQRYNTFIEQAIINHPEQWLWMHRRFKAAQLA